MTQAQEQSRSSPADGSSVRVLIADDKTMSRTSIRLLLSTEPGIEIVAEARDGAQAVEQARSLRPDVVLMDVRMPGMDGIEATKQITSDEFSGPDQPIKVLILTTYHVDDAVYAALRGGASGFLLRDSAPVQLGQAIHTVAGGDAWLDPAVARGLISEFAARPEPRLPAPAEMQELTSRELDVLVLAAHGLSNSDIAAHLFIGEATVKTHLGRVLMKLGLRDRSQAIAAAYQTGLVKPGSCLPPPGTGYLAGEDQPAPRRRRFRLHR
ncbi:response regulator [Cryptosporangium sp. NPDC051539]|uniref:response regulator n=1 Tax=Cryptosporangium sp. NPDC051539 TaxID=3363962 RepID=UPI0037AA120F